MIEYIVKYHNRVLNCFVTHIELTVFSVVIAFCLASILALIAYHSKIVSYVIDGLLNAAYAIPTLAMFSLLIPLTGIGGVTAVITIVIFNQFILVKSILSALGFVELSVLESAKAMGMSRLQVFLKVQLPLATPLVLNGLKLSFTATISGATLSAAIGAGGLGELIFEGMVIRRWTMVYWGVILSTLLAFTVNQIFQLLENRSLAYTRGER